MKFKITYQNGKTQEVSTTCETVADQINQTFGLTEAEAVEFGVAVEIIAEDDSGVQKIEAINPEGGPPDTKLPASDAQATHNATTTHGVTEGQLVEASPTENKENSLDLKQQVATATPEATEEAPVVITSAPVPLVPPSPIIKPVVSKNKKSAAEVPNPFAKSEGSAT